MTQAKQNILRETVEKAVETNDSSLIIRAVFADTVGGSDVSSKGGTTRLSGTQAPGTRGSSSGLESDDVAGSGADEAEEAKCEVLGTLQQLALKQETNILELCKANVGELSDSISNMGTFVEYTESLQGMVQSQNQQLQDAGQQLLSRMKQLEEQQQVLHNMQQVGVAVQNALSVLRLVKLSCVHAQNGRLYKALSCVNNIRLQYLDGKSTFLLPQQVYQQAGLVSTQSLSLSQPQSTSRGLGDTIAASAPQLYNSYVPLRRAVQPLSPLLYQFVQGHVDTLEAAIEQQIKKGLNDWLVDARSFAKVIGATAIRAAATARQNTSDVALERSSILDTLDTSYTMSSVEHVVQARFEADIAAQPPPPPPTGPPPVPENTPPMCGLSLGLLHKCVFLARCLGKMGQFKEVYAQQRMLQMQSELTTVGDFVTTYQGYLGQLVGFFIIEDRVATHCRDLSGFPPFTRGGGRGRGQQLWSTAMASIKATLDATFDHVSSPQTLLSIKDYVTLTCTALGNTGYHVQELQDMVAGNLQRYSDLLSIQAQSTIQQYLSPEYQALHKVSTEQEASLLKGMGLPEYLDDSAEREGGGGGVRPAPYTAPYAKFVPELVKFLRSITSDSVTFMTYTISHDDVLPRTRQFRDVVITRTITDALLSYSTSLDVSRRSSDGGGGGGLKGTDMELMRLVTSAWAIEKAVEHIDAYTCMAVRGIPISNTQQTAKIAQSWVTRQTAGQRSDQQQRPVGCQAISQSFIQVMDHAQAALLRSISANLSSQLTQYLSSVAWTTSSVRQSGRGGGPPQSIIDVQVQITQLQSVVGAIMPAQQARALLKAAVVTINNNIIDYIKRVNTVPAISPAAMCQVSMDLAPIREWYGGSGLGAGGGCGELAPITQLCTLFRRDNLAGVLDSEVRSREYGAVDMGLLVSVLERYQDVGGMGGGEAWPSKRFVQGLVEKLKRTKGR